jgi:hypothetical protein
MRVCTERDLVGRLKGKRMHMHGIYGTRMAQIFNMKYSVHNYKSFHIMSNL